MYFDFITRELSTCPREEEDMIHMVRPFAKLMCYRAVPQHATIILALRKVAESVFLPSPTYCSLKACSLLHLQLTFRMCARLER